MSIQTLAQRKPGLMWIVASAAGAAIGVLFARLFFLAGMSPATAAVFSIWELVGFTFTVAIVFGVSQSLALVLCLKVFRGNEKHTRAAALLWTPLTAVGVFTIMFPVWSVEGEALTSTVVLVLALPGIAILSCLQSLAIHWWVPWYQWLLRTVVGTLIGMSIGLFIAKLASVMLSLSIPMGLSLEAAIVGFSIGGMQYAPIQNLRKHLPVPRLLLEQ